MKAKTVDRDDLIRMCQMNSKKLPIHVNDGGVRKTWVGIGWVSEGAPRGDEPLVTDNKKRRSQP